MQTQDQHELLDQARPYCIPSTGEVVQRLPDELMQQLRVAKLARGLPVPSDQTHSSATWFVFFTDEIREHVLRELRAASDHRKRKRKRKAVASSVPRKGSSEDDSFVEPPADSRPSRPAQRGLAQFRSSRRPAK